MVVEIFNTLESSDFISLQISLSPLELRDKEMLSLLARIWYSTRLDLLLHVPHRPMLRYFHELVEDKGIEISTLGAFGGISM